MNCVTAFKQPGQHQISLLTGSTSLLVNCLFVALATYTAQSSKAAHQGDNWPASLAALFAVPVQACLDRCAVHVLLLCAGRAG
jgi:hypothetical protein